MVLNAIAALGVEADKSVVSKTQANGVPSNKFAQLFQMNALSSVPVVLPCRMPAGDKPVEKEKPASKVEDSLKLYQQKNAELKLLKEKLESLKTWDDVLKQMEAGILDKVKDGDQGRVEIKNGKLVFVPGQAEKDVQDAAPGKLKDTAQQQMVDVWKQKLNETIQKMQKEINKLETELMAQKSSLESLIPQREESIKKNQLDLAKEKSNNKDYQKALEKAKADLAEAKEQDLDAKTNFDCHSAHLKYTTANSDAALEEYKALRKNTDMLFRKGDVLEKELQDESKPYETVKTAQVKVAEETARLNKELKQANADYEAAKKDVVFVIVGNAKELQVVDIKATKPEALKKYDEVFKKVQKLEADLEKNLKESKANSEKIGAYEAKQKEFQSLREQAKISEENRKKMSKYVDGLFEEAKNAQAEYDKAEKVWSDTSASVKAKIKAKEAAEQTLAASNSRIISIGNALAAAFEDKRDCELLVGLYKLTKEGPQAVIDKQDKRIEELKADIAEKEKLLQRSLNLAQELDSEVVKLEKAKAALIKQKEALELNKKENESKIESLDQLIKLHESTIVDLNQKLEVANADNKTKAAELEKQRVLFQKIVADFAQTDKVLEKLIENQKKMNKDYNDKLKEYEERLKKREGESPKKP